MPGRNAERKSACRVSRVISKLNTSRHQVKELTRQQSDTKTKLSKLNHDKKQLEREVIELRKKIDKRGHERKTQVTFQDDDKTIIHKSTTLDRRFKEEKMVAQQKIGKSQNSSNHTRLRPTISSKAMRQRLILLNHASQCTSTNCIVTRHCAEMKGLWNHIMGDQCNDPNCSVRHCLSSRCVLSHYQRCQQSRSPCVVCDSVEMLSHKNR